MSIWYRFGGLACCGGGEPLNRAGLTLRRECVRKTDKMLLLGGVLRFRQDLDKVSTKTAQRPFDKMVAKRGIQ